MKTLADAVAERHAHDAAIECKHVNLNKAARTMAEHNAKERLNALDDPRIGLVMRKGRLVAYAFVNGQYREGSTNTILAALHGE